MARIRENHRELITALFVDDPSTFLDLLMDACRHQKKEEPELGSAWAEINRNLDLARQGAKPLYRK